MREGHASYTPFVFLQSFYEKICMHRVNTLGSRLACTPNTLVPELPVLMRQFSIEQPVKLWKEPRADYTGPFVFQLTPNRSNPDNLTVILDPGFSIALDNNNTCLVELEVAGKQPIYGELVSLAPAVILNVPIQGLQLAAGTKYEIKLSTKYSMPVKYTTLLSPTAHTIFLGGGEGASSAWTN